MATFAQFERRLIGQWTKEALAVRRDAGMRLGKPPSIDPDVARRIRLERAAGATLRQIAEGLNANDVPTARGGSKWRPSSIEAVVRSEPLIGRVEFRAVGRFTQRPPSAKSRSRCSAGTSAFPREPR